MKLSGAWKALYAEERAALGEAGMRALLGRAPDVRLPAGGALLFPHTYLAAAGHFVAAVARAVVRSGCEEVLALGVLHMGREADHDLVERARRGDVVAITELRRVHGPGVAGDAGRWTDEYSLDGFSALLEFAAKSEGRRPPRLVKRFPFLVGTSPDDLPGRDELAAICARGAAIVATCDPIHHGAGYGTPEAHLARDGSGTRAWAEAALGRQHAALTAGDYAAFQREAAGVRSDFRDGGPMLVSLLGTLAFHVVDLVLVDYAATLNAPPPTWVCGALTTVERS